MDDFEELDRSLQGPCPSGSGSAPIVLSVLPKTIDGWPLTSLQQRLVKTGGRLIKHTRY
jgi:hypothetical protein